MGEKLAEAVQGDREDDHLLGFLDRRSNGTPVLAIDAGSEKVDPESGEGPEIECNGCFNVFPIPKGIEVSFE